MSWVCVGGACDVGIDRPREIVRQMRTRPRPVTDGGWRERIASGAVSERVLRLRGPDGTGSVSVDLGSGPSVDVDATPVTAAAVPLPPGAALMGGGLLLLGALRRRKRAAAR